jgi:hypothetical protein
MTSDNLKARQPHQLPPLRRPGQIVDELNRRVVGPMQVLREQQERLPFGVPAQEFAHLAQHPFEVDADKLSQQGLALFDGAQPRQLQEPGRRDSSQQSWDGFVCATELCERFKDGMVGFAASIVLHATPTSTGDLAESSNEVLDERGLADARLPCDPEHHASAARDLIPRAPKRQKFLRPADERTGRRFKCPRALRR